MNASLPPLLALAQLLAFVLFGVGLRLAFSRSSSTPRPLRGIVWAWVLVGAASVATTARRSRVDLLDGVSALILVTAVVLFLWAWQHTRSVRLALAFEASQHRVAEMVTDGPFRWVRHPFYSSYIAAWGAAAVGSRSVVVVVGSIAIAGVYVLTARAEERWLLERDPLEYRAYRARTGFLLPRLPGVCWPTR